MEDGSLALHPSLIEAASWRLCSELARRHPHLHIVELHPGGGQYDCLALVSDEGDSVLQANRAGRIHAFDAGERDTAWTWWEYLTSHDPRRFLTVVEQACLLPTVAEVLPSTAATLSWRAIAAALWMHALDVRRLRALNGMLDSSGYGDGERTELVAAFPGIAEAVREGGRNELLGEPAYRFWFLTLDDEPAVAIDCTAGRSTWTDGTTVDLLQVYRDNGRRLSSVVAEALAPALR